MNRAHNAREAEHCLTLATQHFDNISLDLIYGVPGMTNNRWKQNIEKALSFGIPHISSYALTVEPKTALETFIKKGIVSPIDDELAETHFHTLIDALTQKGFVHYELSNFGKEGWFSKNNTAYWQGKSYLGIGPSAHSYDGKNRSWNVRNNTLYIKSIENGKLPSETETLTTTDRYNEYVMTGLRTIWGVSVNRVEKDFGNKYKEYMLQQAKKHMEEHLLYLDGDTLLVTKKGKFLSDGLASDLFTLNLFQSP
jgi:oxygen-independent coproporphyrinogen-3 oxidase